MTQEQKLTKNQTLVFDKLVASTGPMSAYDLLDELRGQGRSVLQMLPYSSFSEDCNDRNGNSGPHQNRTTSGKSGSVPSSSNAAKFQEYEQAFYRKVGEQATEDSYPVFRQDYASVRDLAAKLWSIIDGECDTILYDLECRSIALWLFKHLWGSQGLPQKWKSKSSISSSASKKHQNQISGIMHEIQQFNKPVEPNHSDM